MLLSRISLQNFRSYSKSEFNFSENTTVIIGPNTAGKSNLIESIFLLSTGKSFRAQKDTEMISFGRQVGRVKGSTEENDEKTELETVLSTGEFEGKLPSKKFLVNKVPKRRVDFAGILPTVLFSPLDLDIISGSPSLRRNFLDVVLEQTDREYRLAIISYIKALRQRNALLELAKERGVRNEKQFEYWDSVLIENGAIVTKKRGAFIEFINEAKKDIVNCRILYDSSIISKDRLLQYHDAEEGAGVTLVGPHRDDFSTLLLRKEDKTGKDVKMFGSRGQQRLVILQLKLLQLMYMQKMLEKTPLLLLDDIFSELDEGHINLVLKTAHSSSSGQTIFTTTHEEFVPKSIQKNLSVIELQ